MWGVEHTTMLIIASMVVAFLYFRHPFWGVCAALSQVPFWVGSFDFFLTGLDPIHRNLALDISLTAVFLAIAHLSGKFGCIVLCIVMFSMAVIDLLVMAGLSKFYLALHEALHYVALIVAMRGHKVGKFDRVDSSVRFGRWN